MKELVERMDSRDVTDTAEIPVLVDSTDMLPVLDAGDSNMATITEETNANTVTVPEKTDISTGAPAASPVSRRTRFSVTLFGLVLPAGIMIVASLVFTFLAGHVLPASLVVPSSVLLMVLFEVLGALFAYWLIPDRQKERWLDGASTGDSRSGSSRLSGLLSSPVARFLKIDGFRHQDLLVGMKLGAAMWLGLQVIKFVAVFSGIHVDPSTTTSTLASTSGLWYIFIFLFCVPVLVPFVEELLFRGALSSVFESVLSPRAASILFVVVSTFWFGLAHFQGAASITDLLVVAWTATIGLVNCLLVLRQKTIWGAFGLHMAHNGITVLLMVIASLFV
jgi:putative membrane protein